MITTTDTLTLPESIARQIQIIETESWFHTVKGIATDLRCRVELESRIQKAAYVYRTFDGKKLGRVWENYSGVICYEVNHLSVSRNRIFQACHLRGALTQIISFHF